jgi:hypothetical protein
MVTINHRAMVMPVAIKDGNNRAMAMAAARGRKDNY